MKQWRILPLKQVKVTQAQVTEVIGRSRILAVELLERGAMDSWTGFIILVFVFVIVIVIVFGENFGSRTTGEQA